MDEELNLTIEQVKEQIGRDPKPCPEWCNYIIGKNGYGCWTNEYKQPSPKMCQACEFFKKEFQPIQQLQLL